MIIHPDHKQLAEELLDWAESNIAPEIELMQSNGTLIDIIQSRGYICSNDFMIGREKQLSGTPCETIRLAQGYSIAILDKSEWQGYFHAVHSVFNMMDTVEAFSSIQQGLSNMHELHPNVIIERNEIAAFCSVWLDHENNIAEFEPVGTVPHFKREAWKPR